MTRNPESAQSAQPSGTHTIEPQRDGASEPQREVVRSLTYLGNQYVRMRLPRRGGPTVDGSAAGGPVGTGPVAELAGADDGLVLSAQTFEPKDVSLTRRVRTFLFGVPIPSERAHFER